MKTRDLAPTRGKRKRFDLLAARLAESYSAVPAEEGLAEIERAAAEVRKESRKRESRAIKD